MPDRNDAPSHGCGRYPRVQTPSGKPDKIQMVYSPEINERKEGSPNSYVLEGPGRGRPLGGRQREKLVATKGAVPRVTRQFQYSKLWG